MSSNYEIKFGDILQTATPRRGRYQYCRPGRLYLALSDSYTDDAYTGDEDLCVDLMLLRTCPPIVAVTETEAQCRPGYTFTTNEAQDFILSDAVLTAEEKTLVHRWVQKGHLST